MYQRHTLEIFPQMTPAASGINSVTHKPTLYKRLFNYIQPTCLCGFQDKNIPTCSQTDSVGDCVADAAPHLIKKIWHMALLCNRL